MRSNECGLTGTRRLRGRQWVRLEAAAWVYYGTVGVCGRVDIEAPEASWRKAWLKYATLRPVLLGGRRWQADDYS